MLALWFAIWLLTCFFTTATAAPSWTVSPFNPPAIPLAVRSPFVNVWLPNGNGTALFERWSQYYNGNNTSWTALARVDGTTYRILGAWDDLDFALPKQTSVQITGTSSIFTLKAGPVDLTYSFVSPIDPVDLTRFSMPFSYLVVTASSNDGILHDVQLYSDITAEWVTDPDSNTLVQWKTRETAPVGDAEGLFTHQVWQANPIPFSQTAANRIQDGTVFFSAFARQGLTLGNGYVGDLRQQFFRGGGLDNSTKDTRYRTTGDVWPGFAFSHQLGQVLATSEPVVFGIGHARENAVRYLTTGIVQQTRVPYYLTQYASSEAAMDAFMRDYPRAMDRASQVDSQLEAHGNEISEDYRGILQLSMRQAVAGLELTVARKPDGSLDKEDVMLFVAEYGGFRDKYRVNDVDQMHWMMPFLLYLNPELLKYALRPVLQFHKSGLVDSRYCIQNIGKTYPDASGPSEYEMPVGASAYMINMALAHYQRTGDKSLVDNYYDVLMKFADYLVDTTLSPAAQASISDTLWIEADAKQSNLAIAGIIALAAMSELSVAKDDATASQTYRNTANELVEDWQRLAISKDGTHYVYQYDDDKTWMTMYNLLDEKFLGLGVVPKNTFVIQEGWYNNRLALLHKNPNENKFPLQLLWKRGWTFTAATVWASGTVDKASTRDELLKGVSGQMRNGLSDHAASDWFDVNAVAGNNFNGRPHVGGYFAHVVLQNRTIQLDRPDAGGGGGGGAADDPHDSAILIRPVALLLTASVAFFGLILL
ncbi:hypothetical protein BKA62DRAFT_705981 [Auriculariales sp. MPI-PUGE-AT-0066]|nr:hypothetical protein BKA62DRAFT_705981 [Auriculariales sp. MPI-PUGE-AT-0066]